MFGGYSPVALTHDCLCIVCRQSIRLFFLKSPRGVESSGFGLGELLLECFTARVTFVGLVFWDVVIVALKLTASKPLKPPPQKKKPKPLNSKPPPKKIKKKEKKKMNNNNVYLYICLFNEKTKAFNPKPLTSLNPKPQGALNCPNACHLKRLVQTPNPKPQTPNPKP